MTVDCLYYSGTSRTLFIKQQRAAKIMIKNVFFRYPSFIMEHMDNNWIFAALYAHQRYCVFIFSCLFVGTSGFIFILIAFHQYQIKLLGYRLENSGYSNLSTKMSVNEDQSDYINMKNLIKMHIKIGRFDKSNVPCIL